VIKPLTLQLRAGAVDVYPAQDLSITNHKTQGFFLVIAQEVACVDLKTQQRIEPLVSLADAVLALAKIVGFAPSKKQPFPGVKLLATALDRFSFVKLGFDACPKPLQD
jgi:hypothetical protein